MNINIVTPWFFLILIPALILGVIPFFRLHKKRRMSSKHLIPFIIHLALIFVLTSMLAGIKITETITAPTDNSVVFVVDMSDSNSVMIEEMDERIHDIMKVADLEITRFGLVVFGGDSGYSGSINHGIISTTAIGDLAYMAEKPTDGSLRYLNPSSINYDSEQEYNGSDLSAALLTAKDMIEKTALDTNKRVVLLSDGKETTDGGDALDAARSLINASIKVDGIYLDLAKSTEHKEAQIVSLSTNGKVSYGDEIQFQATVESTSYVKNATVTLYNESGKQIATATQAISKGTTLVDLECDSKKANISVSTVNVVKAELTINNDIIEQNNVFYSWYTVDPIGSMLVVEGDKTQLTLINKHIDLEKEGYTVDFIEPQEFPDSLEKLLVYDEIVLMNVDFEDTKNGMPAHAANNIIRFVEENGRGLLYTCGDNVYDYSGNPEEDGYKHSPISEILPVELNVDNEKQTVALVLAIDLSSSMKELTNTKDDKGKAVSRYQIVVESAKKVITESEFAENDYIGVVVFWQDYKVALPMQEFGNQQNRENIADVLEEELNRTYYYYYVDKDGNPTDQVININNDGGNPGTPENKYFKENGWDAPAQYYDSNIPKGGQDKYNGNQIRTYGTAYKGALQAAADMLSKTGNTVTLEVKQIVFMSDGEPNDKALGYTNTVELLARSGTVTSTIAIGSDEGGISELDSIAATGKGQALIVNSAEELTDDLSKIAESIQGKYFNTAIQATPVRDESSVIHIGVDGYNIVTGYYGTTIKEGATRALYVDNLKPLYAEWDYGNGRVAVFMSNFGYNVDTADYWTEDLFNTDYETNEEVYDNITLVKNILVAPMHRRVDNSGLDYTISRDDSSATIIVNTYAPLREYQPETLESAMQHKEVIKAFYQEVLEDGTLGPAVESQPFKPIASRKYSFTFTEVNGKPISNDSVYVVTLKMLKVDEMTTGSGNTLYVPIGEGYELCDTVSFAVVGKYSKEYDVFNETTAMNGELKMTSIAATGSGGLIETDKDVGDFFAEKLEKDTIVEHDITTPILIIALLLFLLDIVFRNFIIKPKKDKAQMTDEEQIESMRGR
ncbi:MAG: hypothetical protein IJ309_04410 [Clostridia bacterium]|nr:hypothetical protein [Clostridia bacterium]